MSESGITTAVMNLINQHGGVQGLLQQFQQSGMQDKVMSWISHDQNQSISPHEVHQALGSDAIDQAAAESGMSSNDLLHQLSTYLPGMINHMTPTGEVPPTAQHGGLMDMAMSFLRNR